MMNREDHSSPLLKRVSHAAASVAVMISLMMPAYIAPERAVAQPAPPTSEQKRQDAASDEGTNRRLPSLGARTVNKDELAPESLKKIQEKAELFGEILADLQDLYVEPVDLDKLAETGFQAMLTSLDPYTEFENIEAAKVMRTQTIGNYGGVGLVISKNKDEQGKDKPYITIANAFEGLCITCMHVERRANMYMYT
jgi:C-terminal processing protease CtpA/Prc